MYSSRLRGFVMPEYIVLLKLVGVSVKGLRSLFAHHSSSHMPPPQPLYYMIFKNMHFREYCGMWETGAIVRHELVNILL